MAKQREVIFEAALAMALDRLGGSITYTQAEYLAMRARRGGEHIATKIDRNVKPPTITVMLAPAPVKADDPVQ
jgi:hypothetical protein